MSQHLHMAVSVKNGYTPQLVDTLMKSITEKLECESQNLHNEEDTQARIYNCICFMGPISCKINNIMKTHGIQQPSKYLVIFNNFLKARIRLIRCYKIEPIR